MISKCIVDSRNLDNEARVVIFKSGFVGMYILFYEDPYYTSEFEYIKKDTLIKRVPELKEEIEQL